MARLLCTALILIMTALPAAADTAAELDKWFRDGYAALYVENSWDRADEFAQYFADEIVYQSAEGRSVADVNEFVVNSLEVWRNEGWVGTDVERLDTKMLNATTVLFNVKWRDRNDDGSTGNECGWYFADRTDGQWLLSQYIQVECVD